MYNKLHINYCILLYIIVYYCTYTLYTILHYSILVYLELILISSENASVITLAMNELERNSLYYSKYLVSLQILSKLEC